jgi:hypothetical protein
VHLIFHCDFGVSGDSINVVPVDSLITLGPKVSQALGYESVTLLPGLYPVDYSRYQFGETYIDATLESPTPTRTESWGALKQQFH